MLLSRNYSFSLLYRTAAFSAPQIFAESIFPQTFSDAAQDSYMESQETYSSLFADQSKYNAIMSVLSEMLYREMRRPGRAKNKEFGDGQKKN